MADIEKIIDGINIPKQLIDKSEALLKTLFGPSFTELGGLIADEVKLRRFNNQVKIFTRAQERLRQNNINPQAVSLKVLAPLIEYSSLEEDENLQNKWSNLIAHVVGGNPEIVFQQNCIAILNRISSHDAILLDQLHELLIKRRVEYYAKQVIRHKEMRDTYPTWSLEAPKNPEDISLDSFTFNVSRLSKEMGTSPSEVEFRISSLISLGLLKWQTDVDVYANKSSEDPDDRKIDVDVSVSNNDDFIFTSIGDKFITICKDL